MDTQKVSPLEAVDEAYRCPVDLTTDERAMLALLARRHPNSRPAPEELYGTFDKMSQSTVDRNLRGLRHKGLVKSVMTGRGRGRRTYYVLNLKGQLTVPPELATHPTWPQKLETLNALADADSQIADAPPLFEVMRRMLADEALAATAKRRDESPLTGTAHPRRLALVVA